MDSGIALTTEPFLRSLILAVYRHKLGELLKRTRIEIDLDKGRSMMGTVDETGTLGYGEVFVQYSAKLNQPNVDTRVLTGTVVIAKNPCFHPGDMRKFKAVDNPQLHHMVDVVVFPIKGPRPHPNEMSGSDLDGDIYFVCWDESLIPPKPTEAPMDYTAKDKELLSRRINEDDMINFFARYIESDQLGVIANAHLVHADAQKDHIFSFQCLDLAQKHSDAVDFPKTGCLVTIPFELRPQGYPHYMHKRDKPIYRSNHVLAALYDQCKAIDSTIRASCLSALLVDDAFLVSGYEYYLDTARELRDFYQGQLRALMANFGIVSEAEIVSGHVNRIVQRQSGTLKREYIDTVDLVRRHLEAVKIDIRSMFFEEFGGEDKKAEYREQAIKKISAVYRVVYDSDEELGISLPWMFIDLLMSARSWLKDNSGCTEQNTISRKTNANDASLLGVLTEDIMLFSNSFIADKQLRESREKRVKVLEVLRTAMAERQLSAIDFISFGSTVTRYDHPSSTLDVLVVYGGSDVDPLQATEVINVLDALPLIEKRSASNGNKPLRLTVDKQDVVVHWNNSSLRRTAKILDITSKNKWIIPIVHVILRWAREKTISGSRQNCLMTPEQLVLLFIAFVENEMAMSCAKSTTEDVEKVMQLLLVNHFQDCEISQCQHIDMSQCEQRNPPVMADILLRFLCHYSQLRGQVVKDSRDVSFAEEEVKLVTLADPQYGCIAERMLQAYYTLASSSSLSELLQISGASAKEHRVIPLVRQVASVIIFVEIYFEENLRRTSGATSVKILRKRFPNTMAGLCLDVWGDQRSLLLIEDRVRDLEQMSMLFVRSTAAIERQLIHGAYLTVLENSRGPTAELAIELYKTGIVQPKHRQMQADDKIHVPRLLNPSPSDAYSLETFISCVMKQVEFLNQSYDETLFGELRAVISYGTSYVIADKPPPKMTEEQLLQRLSLGLPTNNENLVNPDRILRRPRASRAGRGSRRPWTARGKTADYQSYSSMMMESFCNLSVKGGRRVGAQRAGVGRSRGSYSVRGANAHTGWRAAYIPARDFQQDSFEAFLKDKGFEFDEDYEVYLITVKLKMSGYPSDIYSVLLLDDQLRLKGLTMTDTKWVCVNIYTDKVRRTNERAINDIRFRIHSRVSLSPTDMAKHTEDCADLLENHRKLLIRDKNCDVIGVDQEYRERIDFVRYKNCRVYRLAENPQVSFIWSTLDTSLYSHSYSRLLNRTTSAVFMLFLSMGVSVSVCICSC